MNRSLLALVPLAALLGGCATSWTVDSQVTSFSRLAPGAVSPATYRFERLPSQQAQEATQLELEAMAGSALAGVGLTRNDAAPRYSAQISARSTVEVSPWGDPWWGGGWGPRYGYGMGWGYYGGPRYYGSWGMWGAPYPYYATPWYTREVSLVLRELPDNQVVYETRASHDGPYSATLQVFNALFQAAVQGFPNPPAGVRRVDVLIQPKATTTASAPMLTVPAEVPAAAPAAPASR